MFNGKGKIVNDDGTDQERNIAVLGNYTSDNQNYKILNGMREEMNDFITMKAPKLLVYVIATNGNQNEEPHFNQMVIGTKQVTTTSSNQLVF